MIGTDDVPSVPVLRQTQTRASRDRHGIHAFLWKPRSKGAHARKVPHGPSEGKCSVRAALRDGCSRLGSVGTRRGFLFLLIEGRSRNFVLCAARALGKSKRSPRGPAASKWPPRRAGLCRVLIGIFGTNSLWLQGVAPYALVSALAGFCKKKSRAARCSVALAVIAMRKLRCSA